MSNEELWRMAEEAGFVVWHDTINFEIYEAESDSQFRVTNELVKFASLVQRATAEDCAKVCEGMPDREYKYPLTREENAVECGWETGRMNCATAIRTKYLPALCGEEDK